MPSRLHKARETMCEEGISDLMTKWREPIKPIAGLGQ